MQIKRTTVYLYLCGSIRSKKIATREILFDEFWVKLLEIYRTRFINYEKRIDLLEAYEIIAIFDIFSDDFLAKLLFS